MGAEKVEADFDIYEIIHNNKVLRQYIEVMKQKLQMEGDPKFE